MVQKTVILKFYKKESLDYDDKNLKKYEINLKNDIINSLIIKNYNAEESKMASPAL